MIHPAYLMDVLERIVNGEKPNQIIVSKEIQEGSLLALNRMLSIPK
jgi:quinolinate synthase